MKKTCFATLCLLASALCAMGQVHFTLQPDVYGTDISESQYGIFFEEINHAADGGLWSEMVSNRSFEDSNSNPDNWHSGNNTQLSLASNQLMNSAQQQYLHVAAPAGSGASIINDGYWGMRLDGQSSYTLSLFARADVAFTTMLTASLIDYDTDEVLLSASKSVSLNTTWQKYTLTIPDNAHLTGKARLRLQTTSSRAFDMDVVSLMPTDTYKGHGCRKDLAQMLEDLKPRFMRFPGGCYVEGQYSNGERNRFEWKKTIGNIENRPGHWNISWNYRSSDGFGFHEMLQLSEDLGAVPLFVVNVGLGHGWYQDFNDMDDFIQEALDAIEYANGDTTTTWGAMRAANGHPEPFGLKYIEIGNENYNYTFNNNSDQSYQYPERYNMFYQAIKAAYPDIVCIGNVESWGTDSPSWRNSYPVDLVDEHYYRWPAWFVQNYEKYDTYDRSGPMIYPGEYAVTQDFGTTGSLAAALGEAIYMQGMERNSDIVKMASYAPIFVNENDQHWMPDMIRFDATHSYGTPSYYVQKLMSQKLGTRNITWEEESNHTEAAQRYAGLSTWSTSATFSDFSITQGGETYVAPFDGSEPWTDMAGTFSEANGTLTQRSTSMQGQIYLNEHVTLGDNYTIRVKATKTSGAEGFLIVFGYEDSQNYCWWNLGGWNNSRHALEVCSGGTKTQYASTSGYLQTRQTYDLRIEVATNRIKCYIDDVLYHDVVLPMQRRIYTSASRDGDKLYLKLVNPNGEAYSTTLTTSGYTASDLVLTQMTAESSTAENTADNMYRVAPVEKALQSYGTDILLDIPAYSFNIIEMNLTAGETTGLGLMPEEGIYYLKDIDSGLYLSRGSTWGTRSSLSRFGVPVALTHSTADIYSLRYLDLNEKYLGELTSPYTDVTPGSNTLWRFRGAGDGYVWLENVGTGTYFVCTGEGDGADFTNNSATATRFQLVKSTAYEAEMATANPLQEATQYGTVTDVTALMENASMAQGIDGWESTFHTYYNSGNEPVYTATTNRASVNEAYERMGELTQTVTGLNPGGVYRFSIPAFFRAASRELCLAAENSGITLGNAYLICGDERIRMKTWASERLNNSEPNSMETAATCFSNGRYLNSIVGRADANGNLTIGLGIGHRIPGQWIIWGAAKLEVVTEAEDYTANIINPSFESSLTTGWTNNGMQRQNNTETKAGKTGTYYCEKWVQSPSSLPDASVTQTVTGLRDGDYILTATCHAEQQGSNLSISGVYLMAGDNRTAVTQTDTYTVTATAINGTLTIGFGCEDTNANWITVDNFQLKWIGSSLESNKAALQSLISKLQSLIDTKTILSQQQRDDAEEVISRALAADTEAEVSQAISEVTAKYEELDAYRLPIVRNDNCNAYLFAYFPSNSDENLYYALSTDGFNYTPLNNGSKILDSREFTRSGGIRDPHILRGEDGVFRMVNTDMRSALGWSSNRGIVMSKSTDLIHWTHSIVHFPTRFPNGWSSVTRVWAPETIYDREAGRYMVYFSLLTSDDGTCNYDKVFYCYANDDFTDLMDYPVHMFDRGSATIDADIVFDETDQLYHMIYKNEGINSISHVTASRLTAADGEPTGSQWGQLGGGIQQTSVAVEGGGIFRLIDENKYVVMYDCYGSGYYQFCTTEDWRTYTLVAQTNTSGAFTPRHGSVTPLHPAETLALLKAFPTNGFNIPCGDVNKDGNLDTYDVEDVARYLLGLPTTGATFDEDEANMDGRDGISLSDLTKLVNMIIPAP